MLTGVAALARMPGRLIGTIALVAGLGILQGLIRAVADALRDPGATGTTAGTLIFGLHAVNGLVMLGLAETAARRARALSRSATVGDPRRAAAPGPAGPAS